MPEISRFLGIVISMYINDHMPPHFHAKYGDFEIIVNISTGVVRGQFPKRALSAVLEWYDMHKDELMSNWHRAQNHQALQRIDPLE